MDCQGQVRVWPLMQRPGCSWITALDTALLPARDQARPRFRVLSPMPIAPSLGSWPMYWHVLVSAYVIRTHQGACNLTTSRPISDLGGWSWLRVLDTVSWPAVLPLGLSPDRPCMLFHPKPKTQNPECC